MNSSYIISGYLLPCRAGICQPRYTTLSTVRRGDHLITPCWIRASRQPSPHPFPASQQPPPLSTSHFCSGAHDSRLISSITRREMSFLARMI
ncbi:hypothetical protein E2C01_036920 [Portunus trituberculatus]|uniref:Uncharacterized protein n=1 Tax=Portunus trituberculatus TaxID=210409 RepID=A0A5B7FCJ2_PORTR|nr:hypothetical protein [Portunus trituberculatus]